MVDEKCYAGKAGKMSFTAKGIRKKEHMDVEMMRAELLSHGGMVVWFLAAEFCCDCGLHMSACRQSCSVRCQGS